MSKKNGFKHKQLDIRIKLGISLLVGLLVFFYTKSDAFNTWSTQLSDPIYQTESVSTLPISIVRIDEKTMAAINQPGTWSRQVYADILNKLNYSDEYHPAVIVFDLMFTGYKDAEGDAALAEAAKKYNNVIAGVNLYTYEQGSGDEVLTLENLYVRELEAPYKELNDNVTLGYVNCDSGKYSYVTTFLTGLHYNDKWYDCLAVATLKKFKEYVESNREFALLHPEYEDIILPDFSQDEHDEYRFTYTSSPGDFDSISLIDLLESDYSDEDIAKRFSGGIVLVGAYASGLTDEYRILFSGQSKMNGVEIHANIMEALYEDKIQTEASLSLLGIIYALISFGSCMAILSVDIIKGILIGVAELILHLIISIIIYHHGSYIPLLYMGLTCLILIIGAIFFHYLMARSERVKINNAFRMYVAPEIVDDVAGSGTYQLQLGGRHKDIAVLFVDIRGFTTMSENLTPEEVVDILNEYFGVITDAIFKNKGTLDKFIGDAAMAVFNSPFDLDDYVYRAVSTACDIAKASEALGEKLMERFGKKVSYGIGVNCGEAIIGNIGSNFRMDYTAIGDTVNTASRLESNAKAGEILISEEVKKRLEGRLETEDVGEIPLKGKSKKIFVYRVLSLKDTAAPVQEVVTEAK